MSAFNPMEGSTSQRITHTTSVMRTWLVALGIVSSLVAFEANAAVEAKPLQISETSFQCMTKMTKVRGFYVDNLLGNKSQTLAVAKSKKGGVYPPGSVVQVTPGEVMVKGQPGSSPVSKDWEFFELDVSPEGSKIRRRGFADVVNRFGGNCFACHVQAKPEWDMICEQSHGCQPVPVTHAMFTALQKSDPRCVPANPLTQADKDALAALQEVMKTLPMPKAETSAPVATN